MPTRTATAVLYDPFERIRVEVKHEDDCWYPGWLHAWLRTPSGWRASVTYHVGAGLQHYLDVPDDHVRQYDDLDDDPDDTHDDTDDGGADSPGRDGG